MDRTQKRWSVIVNVLYFIMLLGAFYLFMKYAFWLLFPFIVAFFVAAMLQKPLNFLTKSKRAPKGVISAVLSLLVFGFIFGLIALGGAKLVYTVRDLITYFTDRCSNLSEFFDVLKTIYLNLDIAAKLPSYVNDSITNGIDTVNGYFSTGDIFNSLTDNLSKYLAPIGSAISAVPSILAGVLISVVASCFMTASYGEMKAFILRQFSDEKRHVVVKTKHILVSSVGKICRAYALIILITTVELFIGLSILKIIGVSDSSHIFTVSLLIALIDIFPVLGTGTVMIPWSIYSFVTGDIGMGIGLLVIYAVISVIRQIIEPKLVAGQVGISPVVTIIAMYVGIKIFGALGIFILPLFVIIIKLLNDEGIIHLFHSNPEDMKHNDETDDSACETEAGDSLDPADNQSEPPVN